MLNRDQQIVLLQWINEGRRVYEFVLKYEYHNVYYDRHLTEYKSVIGSFRINEEHLRGVVYEKTKKS